MESSGPEDVNLERIKKKFGRNGHTLRKDGEIPKANLKWNRQGNRKRGRPKNIWRRWVISKKREEAGMN
jgi:hypothetical protein